MSTRREFRTAESGCSSTKRPKPSGPPSATDPGHRAPHEHGLLIRRSPAAPTGSGFFQCGYPSGAQLAELVGAARAENAVQDIVRWANENIGLNHYQMRRYDAWYRHMTLCILAGAVAATTGLNP